MQVDKLKSDEISNISSQIEKWKSIDILYFADSFGNMSPKDVKNTILSIKKGWSGKVGFHAHDNKGQAITNCLTAIDNHIDIIDSMFWVWVEEQEMQKQKVYWLNSRIKISEIILLKHFSLL